MDWDDLHVCGEMCWTLKGRLWQGDVFWLSLALKSMRFLNALSCKVPTPIIGRNQSEVADWVPVPGLAVKF